MLTLIRSVPLKVRVGHRGPDIEGRLDIFLCLVHVLDHLDLELFQVWLNILLLLWDILIPRNSITTWNTLNKKERCLLFTINFLLCLNFTECGHIIQLTNTTLETTMSYKTTNVWFLNAWKESFKMLFYRQEAV